jgi:hypothetical protein
MASGGDFDQEFVDEGVSGSSQAQVIAFRFRNLVAR